MPAVDRRLDSLWTETITTGSKEEGEYVEVRLGGGEGALIVDATLRKVLKESKNNPLGSKQWGFSADCLWVRGKFEAEFQVTLRRRPFFAILERILTKTDETVGRMRAVLSWTDPTKSSICFFALGSLAFCFAIMSPEAILAASPNP